MESSSLENDVSKIDNNEKETTLESHNDPEFDINSNVTKVPEETKWEKIRFLGCCPLARLLPTYRTYFRYWEIDFLMPLFVTLIILFNVLVYSIIVLPKLPLAGIISSCVFVFIFLVLFLISYFMAMCMDPGYLPYDWITRQKTKYTPDELYPGIALRKEQKQFAKDNRCPYASFSEHSGLFVIRGDHICGWVTNWIGKRNHKQFLLMLLYGSLYCISSFITKFFVPNFFHLKNSNLIPLIISSIFEISFGLTLLPTFFAAMTFTAHSETQISVYKNIKVENKSTMDGFREVCGQKPLICWICPSPAFPDDITNIL